MQHGLPRKVAGRVSNRGSARVESKVGLDRPASAGEVPSKHRTEVAVWLLLQRGERWSGWISRSLDTGEETMTAPLLDLDAIERIYPGTESRTFDGKTIHTLL